jgi:hypothetical protein
MYWRALIVSPFFNILFFKTLVKYEVTYKLVNQMI